MVRMTTVFTIITLLGCGTEPGGSGAAQLAPEEQREEQQQAVRTDALYVADASKLPACDVSSESRLVYVKSDENFMACTEGAWVDVDIKGAKGEKGEQGTQGEKGDIGEEGEPGVALDTTWRDPATDRLWAIGSLVARFAPACGTGFVLPTADEAQDGWDAGLGTAVANLTGADAIWLAWDTEGTAIAFNESASNYTQAGYKAIAACFKAP